MGPTRPKRQFALDANLMFDLAADVDAAHDFRETFSRKGYLLRLAPTATQELFNFHLHAPPQKRALATRALLNMRAWGISSFDLIAVGHGIAASFAHRLFLKQLLPPEEFNDGLILAETSMAEIPVLVTSDKHLLDIDETALRLTSDEADLFHVIPCHPQALLRAVR